MNKRYFVSLLLCLLVLPITSKAENYVSISELNAQPPARWTQTYETQWRTVEIDVQPMVPKVDSVPILKVVPDFAYPDVSMLGSEWTSARSGEDYFAAFLNGGGELELREAEKKLEGTITTVNYSPPFDMDVIYAENSNLTLGEAIDLLKSILLKINEEPDQWQFDQPNYIQCNAVTSKKSGEFLLPGSYGIFANQSLYGIPIECHVIDAIQDGFGKENWYMPSFLYSIQTKDTLYFSWEKVKTTDYLANDVPLCDYSIIQTALEEEILAGHVRKIFDLNLGYALYNEPGESQASILPSWADSVYYAVPVWVVHCYYVESSKKEMRDYTGIDVPEHGVMEYKTLVVNAQTGEVMDRSDNHKGCGDYQGFISWEDVGGRP